MKLNHGQADVVINWSGGLHHAKKAEVMTLPDEVKKIVASCSVPTETTTVCLHFDWHPEQAGACRLRASAMSMT